MEHFFKTKDNDIRVYDDEQLNEVLAKNTSTGELIKLNGKQFNAPDDYTYNIEDGEFVRYEDVDEEAEQNDPKRIVLEGFVVKVGWQEDVLTEITEEEAEAIANPPPTLKEAKQSKTEQVNATFTQITQPIIGKYPEAERLTWKDQETIAKQYLDDSTIDPRLQMMADTRDISVQEMVDKIMENVTTFNAVWPKLCAKRQSLCKQVKLSESIQEIEAIDPSVLYSVLNNLEE